MPIETPKTPHVALIIETSRIYGRELLNGIRRYIRLHQPWSIYALERGLDDPDPSWLQKWHGEGLITRSMDKSGSRKAQKRGIPVVSLRHLQDNPPFPTIFPDQAKISNRIVDHFCERGFRQFAYVGVAGNQRWELLRCEAFCQALRIQGFNNIHLRPYLAKPGIGWEQGQEILTQWIKELPKPIGIMANFDIDGMRILDACRQAGAVVPDEVAVVSVDNDPVLCEIAPVPLSSLDQRVEVVGYMAAELLDRMMQGGKVEAKNYFTEPGDVIERQSSDVIAVDDRNLTKAIRFTREQACNGINVNDIAHAAGISRRALEKKFSERIGRSPLQEINIARIRRVKQLLLETDYALPQIAELSGFEYQEYMVRLFRKSVGMTPGEFRKQMRFG